MKIEIEEPCQTCKGTGRAPEFFGGPNATIYCRLCDRGTLRRTVKLTESMLEHLAATCSGRQVGGMSMRALESRELIYRYTNKYGRWKWLPTVAGQLAMRTARAEGW